MKKLSVENAELNNGIFTCECWIGDNETHERKVFFDELVTFLNGKDGMIPVTESGEDENEYDMLLTEWIDNHDRFDLEWELARCINTREYRAEFEPRKTEKTELFGSLKSIVV